MTTKTTNKMTLDIAAIRRALELHAKDDLESGYELMELAEEMADQLKTACELLVKCKQVLAVVDSEIGKAYPEVRPLLAELEALP
jgi:hypothetical protein